MNKTFLTQVSRRSQQSLKMCSDLPRFTHYELTCISPQILTKANDLIYAIYIDFTSSVLLL